MFAAGAPTPAVLAVVRQCRAVLDISGPEARMPKFYLPSLLNADAEDDVGAAELLGDILYSPRVDEARRVVLYVPHAGGGGGKNHENRVQVGQS
jgi:hypothetical protein